MLLQQKIFPSESLLTLTNHLDFINFKLLDQLAEFCHQKFIPIPRKTKIALWSCKRTQHSLINLDYLETADLYGLLKSKPNTSYFRFIWNIFRLLMLSYTCLRDVMKIKSELEFSFFIQRKNSDSQSLFSKY